MLPSQIQREILIDAPVEVVWRIITEPDQIVRWFSQEAELEPHAGGRGRLRFTSGHSVQLKIESVEPPRRFAFRWAEEKGPVARMDNSMLVEFTLRPEAGGTLLRVVETGYDRVDWSDEDKEKYVEEHTHGWRECLERLEEYAPRAQGVGRQ